MFDNAQNTEAVAAGGEETKEVDVKSLEVKNYELEKEETDLLKSLVVKQGKQLFYTRITCIAMVVFVAAIVIVLAVLTPKCIEAITQANKVLGDVEIMVADAQASLDEIDVMSQEITTAAKGINSLVDDNAAVLNDSMTKLNGIDFEGLNGAIKDLSDVVEPMANFMNRFR